jgi:hypothetical protein
MLVQPFDGASFQRPAFGLALRLAGDRGRSRCAAEPIRAMSPMPYGIRRHGLSERIGGGRPLAGRLLAGEHEAGSVSAGEPRR